MLVNIWKGRRILFRLLLLLGSLVYCSRGAEDPLLVSVGSSALRTSDIDSLLLAEERLEDYVARWLEDELFYQEARRWNLHKRDDVRRRQREAERQILVQAYIEDFIKPRVVVHDSEITRYYEEHIEDFVTSHTLYRIKYLFLTDSLLARSIADSLRLAPELFDSFAVRYSEGLFRQNYDPGYLTKDELPSFVARKLRSLSSSRIVGPIKGEAGFYFIRLAGVKRKGDVLELADVRAIIRSQLFSDKYDSLLSLTADSLREVYRVYVNDSLLGEL